VLFEDRLDFVAEKPDIDGGGVRGRKAQRGEEGGDPEDPTTGKTGHGRGGGVGASLLVGFRAVGIKSARGGGSWFSSCVYLGHLWLNRIVGLVVARSSGFELPETAAQPRQG
jgi:hypothetical protein